MRPRVRSLHGCCRAVRYPGSKPKPNIVHILTDDLGWQDIACYYRAIHGEESLYETPHMDRLSARGGSLNRQRMLAIATFGRGATSR